MVLQCVYILCFIIRFIVIWYLFVDFTSISFSSLYMYLLLWFFECRFFFLMIRRPPRSTRTDTLPLHDALPISKWRAQVIANFMFCTGIENSIPTINNGKTRIDQMEACDHYRRWRDDFDLLHDIGLNYLRYGPPIHRTFLGPGRYDWEFTALTRSEERRVGKELVSTCRFVGAP